MASYFDEMNFRPLEDGEVPNHFLDLARLLRDFNMFDELQMQHKLAPPASRKLLKELPDIEVTENGLKCPICLKEHKIGEKLKQLPCKHAFHTECIIPWLEKTNSCPVCRYEFATDDESYEAYRKEKIRAKERERDLEALHNSMFS